MWLVMKIFCMYLLTAILMTGLMGIDAFGGRSGRTFKFCLPGKAGGLPFMIIPVSARNRPIRFPRLNYLNILNN